MGILLIIFWTLFTMFAKVSVDTYWIVTSVFLLAFTIVMKETGGRKE